MDEARAAAGRLAVRGDVDITQGGRVVDIATAREITNHLPERSVASRPPQRSAFG
jgi:hypothetical protein